MDFIITYKQRGFNLDLEAFSDADWGKNPDNAKSMSSYTVFLPNTPTSFKVGLQGLNEFQGGAARADSAIHY